MDLSPDPIDSDEIVQRFGRRLFVLAYHLTGDGAAADELTLDTLTRAALAPDLPATERDAGVFLNRLLIGMWRERLQSPDTGAAPRPVASAPRSREALWRALSRLDPVSRAVLVLRLAEGLEYETIGRVLDMAPDVVYARLLQARAGLREADRRADPALFETMNLYLDARLPGDQRGEFERRVQSDASLREQVEFHRGLTLELHEEAPSLPRDFVPRVHGRIERARETLALVDQAALTAGWEPVGTGPPARPRRWPLVVAGAAAAVIIVALTVALLIALRRSPVSPGTEPRAPAQAGPAESPSATPDAATIEALRSLGYLAPAKDHTTRGAAGRPAGRGAKPARPAAAASPTMTPAAEATAIPQATPTPQATPAPSPPPADSAPSAPAPPAVEPAATAPARAGAAVTWRVLPVAATPRAGHEYEVIRTGQDWAALFAGTGSSAPSIDFDSEMAVLLKSDLGGDPPSRLVVTSVREDPGAVLIACRKEAAAASAVTAGAPAAGQAVVLPAADRPIQIAME